MFEVRAHDTPGLLYSVANTLATLGVNVTSARVHTLGAEAVDIFYLRRDRRIAAGPGPRHRDRDRGGSGAGIA